MVTECGYVVTWCGGYMLTNCGYSNIVYDGHPDFPACKNLQFVCQV